MGLFHHQANVGADHEQKNDDDRHDDEQFHQGKAVGKGGTACAIAAGGRKLAIHGIERLMERAGVCRPIRQNATT